MNNYCNFARLVVCMFYVWDIFGACLCVIREHTHTHTYIWMAKQKLYIYLSISVSIYLCPLIYLYRSHNFSLIFIYYFTHWKQVWLTFSLKRSNLSCLQWSTYETDTFTASKPKVKSKGNKSPCIFCIFCSAM